MDAVTTDEKQSLFSPLASIKLRNFTPTIPTLTQLSNITQNLQTKGYLTIIRSPNQTVDDTLIWRAGDFQA
jgi:hypothetical protein